MHFFKNNLRVLYIIVIMSDKSDISKKFRCKICKKNYASNSSLWNHNNKFHMYVPEKSLPKLDKYLINLKSNLTNKLTCQYCNKLFTRIDNMHVHQNKYCKNKLNQITLIEENKLLKEQLNNLLKFNKMHPKTFQKINNQLINNITNNTINNNNINITYVKFGDEKLSEILTDNEMLKILFECRLGIKKSIELTHFNDKRPELKNIIITNLQNNIGYVFNGEKFEAKPKDDILGDLFDKHLINIENYINESDILQTKIQNNTVLDKIVNYRFPKFIEDLNNDKYRIEKINELKLLTYNKSDSKALRIN